MRFYVRNWYWFGLAYAAIALVLLVVLWNKMDVLQRLLVMNFIALCIHQAEEYGWPGGEPTIMNYALMGSDHPERFPLNQLSAMVTNDLALVLIYGVPVFFPHAIWLGLVGILFGMGQFLVHGVATNIKMRSIYNPGLFAVAFLHVPIGIAYIYFISAHGLATGWDWLWGACLTMVAAALVVGWSTYVFMASNNTSWAFSPKEMARFHVQERLARKGIQPSTGPGTGLYYRTPLAKLQKKLHPRG